MGKNEDDLLWRHVKKLQCEVSDEKMNVRSLGIEVP